MSARQQVFAGLSLVVISATTALWASQSFARTELSLHVKDRSLFAQEIALDVTARGQDELIWQSSPPTTDGQAARGLMHLRALAQFGAHAAVVIDVPQLVGPFQSATTPPCSIRVTIPPGFVDDGMPHPPPAQGRPPATVAAMVQAMLETELAGQAFWPLGKVIDIEPLRIELGDAKAGPDDLRALAAIAARRAGADEAVGFLGVRVAIRLGRARIPIRIAVVPYPLDGQLAFALELGASLDFDYRVLNWAADLAGADKRVTQIIRNALDKAIGPILAPPPALELGDQLLELAFCANAPVHIRADTGISVRFAVPFREGSKGQAPPQIDGDLATVPAAGSIENSSVHTLVDLNLDALNAMLYEGWRTGTLDHELTAAGLERSFNDHPLVRSLLSVRVGALSLELPPVLSRGHASATLAVAIAATVQLEDVGESTLGHVYAGAVIRAAASAKVLARSVALHVAVSEASLACERRAGLWQPCYSLITTAVIDNADALGAAMSASLSSWLTELFIEQRIAVTPNAEAIVVERVALSVIDEPRAANTTEAFEAKSSGDPQTVVRLAVSPRLDLGVFAPSPRP